MSNFRVALTIVGVLYALTGAAAAAERVALVIGNGAYTRVSALSSPEHDAKLMITALGQVGFDVIGGVDMNKEQMETAIIDFGRRLRDAGPDAEGLFYYSGHGVQSGGVNYLIPLHAPIEEESHLNIKAVPAWWVLQQMENAKNRLNLVILDACRNNPFKKYDKNIGGVGGLRGVVKAPKGTLIVYAAAPGKVAYDGGNSRYSPFTEALVNTMALPGVQIEAALKQVRVIVDDKTGGRQEPWSTSSLVGDFCFRPPCSDGSEGLPSPSGQAAPADRMAYDEAKLIDTLSAYLAFRKKFPNSYYADLAVERIRTLGKQGEKRLGLTRETRRQIQEGLKAAGFDPGFADGDFGPRTRAAIRRWQEARDNDITGYILEEDTAKELTALNRPMPPVAEPEPVKPAPLPVPTPVASTCECYDEESCFWCEISGDCMRLDEYRQRYSADKGRYGQHYWLRKSECAAQGAANAR